MTKQRLRIDICGAVQGAGFRPFVYGLAESLDVTGWVRNSTQGVTLEAEGPRDTLDLFLTRLKTEKPATVFFDNVQSIYLDCVGYTGFEIRPSDASTQKTAWILPDLAVCPECRREILDPDNRRYRYPFTNCTRCGPRYSIITQLPYDRPNTSMKNFAMCPACANEYHDPSDRRFHAQPNACPDCGPSLELWDEKGAALCSHHNALDAAAQALAEGKIVAVKGLGGFHLMFDAANDETVRRLRQRKRREEKPLALMARDVDLIRSFCFVSSQEQQLLESPQAPIVLLKKNPACDQFIAPSVAPGNPYLGVMLPYTPLHLLLLSLPPLPHGAIGATSANLSDEPICIDNAEAVERLRGIVDLFLVHNRPIVRPADDSIVRVMADRPIVLRRARGYAPLPVSLKKEMPSVLALGGHLKNTVALSVGKNVFLSPHVGNLETEKSFDAFNRTIETLRSLYDGEIDKVACDVHPEYFSTREAARFSKPVTAVQHHFAHIAACLAENHLEGPVCGIAFDGTGYGLDKTIWGGEIFDASLTGFTRKGCLKPFPLVGGDAAAKEPRRTALSLLREVLGSEALTLTDLPCHSVFTDQEKDLFKQALDKNINVFWTSSCGRLFDGVSSLLEICHYNRFEGQAPMALEFACAGAETKECYSFSIIDKMMPSSEDGPFWHLDWTGAIRDLIKEYTFGTKIAVMALKFHNTIAEMICAAARQVGHEKVILSGGCFQNKILTERTVTRLKEEGFVPYWHQIIPPNDGCLALGQAVAAGYQQ